MTPEDLKERSRRFVDEAWVQGDLAVIDELVAPDIVHHVSAAGPQPAPGTQGVKDFIAHIRTVFAGLRVTYENEIVEGDRAVRHITVRGVHAGEFLGIAPTGRPVTFEVMDVYRFDERGRIAEHWGVVDLFSVFQQLSASTVGSR